MESEGRPVKMRKLEHVEAQEKLMEVDNAAATPVMENPDQETLHLGIAEEQEDAILENEDSVPKLSKSQLKKLRKHQEWEAGREDRKVIRKEKAKEKKIRQREARQQQLKESNGDVTKLPLTRPIRHSAGPGSQIPITVIFDCDFEDLMFDQELKSLGLQITRCYSDNRKAKFRAHLALSSFNGKMKERFDGILAKQYTSWTNFRFFEEDFEAVTEKAKEWMAGPNGGAIAGALATTKEGQNGETHDSSHEEGEIVYLSSESEHTLTQLKPNSTYIIGGLVDKNRHKGVCYKRAVNRGIRTAKLPIGDFLQMSSRQVLVTNHVLEILLKWVEFGNWGKAFMEVMPKRKGGKLRGEGNEIAENSVDEEKRGDTQANGDGKGHGDGNANRDDHERAKSKSLDAVTSTELKKITRLEEHIS